MPWIWIIGYFIISIGVVHIGIDQTNYTAQLFAGDVSVKLVTSLVIITIVNWFGDAVSTIVQSITNARIDRNVRRVVWDKLLRVPMNFFRGGNPRETISRITTDTGSVSSMIVLSIIPFITQVYSIYAVMKQLSKYDARLAYTLLAFIPMVLLVSYIIGRALYSVNHKSASIAALLTEQLSELISNLPLTKAFAKESLEERRGQMVNQRLYKINVKNSWVSKLSSFSFDSITLIQMSIVIIAGMVLLNDGGIKKRAWIAFFMFTGTVISNIENIVVVWNNIKTIQGTTSRIAEIINVKEEQSGSLPGDELSGDIEISHLAFGYDESSLILKDVNCVFHEGEVTALLGLNGCGKSTLLNLIDRVYEPQSGSIKINGYEINQYNLFEYRNQFAVVSQNTMLFDNTIEENMIYGLNKPYMQEEMIAALKLANAYDFVSEFPDGLDTKVGEYGERLSGGQKQRLAIARAVLADRPYLLMDEATAALDTVACSEIMEGIKNVMKGKTTILVAHSPAILSLVDRVAIIENGTVVSYGTKEELIKSSQFFRDFLRKEDTADEVE